tara:strand:+ start:3133 stop:3990 length:858 start_codon:yes stop_codon:yes gene_type:complete
LNLTNNYGAPDSIVDAIRNDPYTKDGADFSVTELIKPPQIRRLWNEHEEEISVDVRDEMFKLIGTAVHNYLDRAPKVDDGKIRERRFHAEHNGVTISGAVDLIDGGVVTDYKVTSAYSVKRGLKQDWERQLNLYAWLLRQNDMTATKLNIVCICRDWMRSKAGKSDSWGAYPDSPVVVLSVPMWRKGRQDDYLAQRVRVHTQQNTIPCTLEERWARGAYQVNPQHSGGGRPRSFDTLQDATDYINKQRTGSYSIKDGNAKYVRCESWCEVAPFCPQWKGEKGNGS